MTAPTADDRTIGITGRGLASSLGSDPITVCAASRAGLVAPAELDLDLTSRTGEMEPAVGHPAAAVTLGFEGFGRQLRLAQVALAGLRRTAPPSVFQHPRCGFYLALPDPGRLATCLDRVTDDDMRRRIAGRAEAAQGDETLAERAQTLLGAAARAAEWPAQPALHHTSASGHAAFVEALAAAARDLWTGKVTSAVVGAVDSLLDADTLTWLSETARLKTPKLPVGLQPGEAGVFFLLEPVRAASARGVRPLAIVRDLEIAVEERSFTSGHPPLGQGLSHVLSALMHRSHPSSPLWCVSDHTGETYRAMDWGHATVRLARLAGAFSPVVWFTAASFGDTGAASAALATCLVTGAFDRGYAPSRSAIVVSSSDGPARAAVLLQAPES